MKNLDVIQNKIAELDFIDSEIGSAIINITKIYLQFSKQTDTKLIAKDLFIINKFTTDLRNLQVLRFEKENNPNIKSLPYDKKWKYLNELPFYQVAYMILNKQHAIKIKTTKGNTTDTNLLGLYNEEEGIYDTNSDTIEKMIIDYNPGSNKKYREEVVEYLNMIAPVKELTKNQDLIAVNNGIFNYKEKKLLPFDKNYVFIAKSKVDYKENPENPIIEMPDGIKWDVVSWVNDLTDDDETRKFLWQIASSIIRPNVPWNRSAWFFSTKGNNGKGTFCTLLRNLCGESSYAAIPLKDFSKDFMLENLIGVTAIITDENPVGTYLDEAADLKSVITGDPILINRKFKKPITYQFKGMMVQCLNEKPSIRDKSNSFYRRQIFVHFEKSFQGVERKYIKEDYLYRKDVLEFVLWKILNTNFYEFSIPEKSEIFLEEFKEYADPIRQFYAFVKDNCVWDLLPTDFIYQLYKEWYQEEVGTAGSLGKYKFIDQFNTIVEEDGVYEITKYQMWNTDKMEGIEPLIIKYNLKEWKNPYYKGSDEKLITKQEKNKYRGYFKILK